MQRTFFTCQEARNKIGHLVEAMTDFPSVPKGSRGKVARAQRRANDQWLICVEWDLPRDVRHFEFMLGDVGLNFFRKNQPIEDQFCKSEYETLLKTV
jgi:hypothetical protein